MSHGLLALRERVVYCESVFYAHSPRRSSPQLLPGLVQGSCAMLSQEGEFCYHRNWHMDFTALPLTGTAGGR